MTSLEQAVEATTRTAGARRFLLSVTGITIAALIAGYFVVDRLDSPRQTIVPSHPRETRPASVPAANAVTTSGTVRLRSGSSVRVGSQVSGIVSRLNVTVGAHISRGDVIAEIDPRTQLARVAQAKAQVFADEIALQKAQSDLARVQRLAASRLISQQQLDDLTWQVKSAAARLGRSQSDSAAAEIDLSYTTIRAPISGTIASVSTQEGETVAASFAAPTFVTIVEERALELVAMVDETDIGAVQLGERMNFTVEAYPSRPFSATVRRIDPTAAIISGVVNYPVIGTIAGDLEGLRPDMTANISIARRGQLDRDFRTGSARP